VAHFLLQREGRKVQKKKKKARSASRGKEMTANVVDDVHQSHRGVKSGQKKDTSTRAVPSDERRAGGKEHLSRRDPARGKRIHRDEGERQATKGLGFREGGSEHSWRPFPQPERGKMKENQRGTS